MAVKTPKKRRIGARQQRIIDAHKARMAKTATTPTTKPKALSLSVVQALEAASPGWTERTYGRSLRDILKSTAGAPTADTMARIAPGGVYDRKAHALRSWKKLMAKYFYMYGHNIDEEYRGRVLSLLSEQTETVFWDNEDWINYNGNRSYSDREYFYALIAALIGVTDMELLGRKLIKEDPVDEFISPDGR